MATVNRPPFWVPRPPDDNIWDGRPIHSQSLVLATTELKWYGAPGQVPTKRWLPQYTLNDPPEWQGAPVHSQSLVLTTTELKWYGAPGQVPTKRWLPQYTLDDPPPWQFETNWMTSASIQLLTHQSFFGAGGQVPTKNWSPYLWDDISPAWEYNANWLNSAIIQILTQQQIFGKGGQVPPSRWNFNYDDPGPWQWPQYERNPNILVVAAAHNPFSPVPWLFNYDETPSWNAQSVGSNIEFFPVNVPRAVFYALRPGDEHFWQPATQRNVNLFPAVATAQPFTPVPWRFNYDDSSVWQITAKAAPVQLLTIAGKPVVPQFWNFNYDETGPQEFWKPFATNTTFTLSSFVQYAPRNNWEEWFAEIDDPPAWQWRYGLNLNINTGVTAPAAPRLPLIWRFREDSDDVGWIGQSIPVNINFFVPTNMPMAPFFALRPVEEQNWNAAPRAVNPAQIPPLPPVNVLNIYRWWFNYDQDPMWQGQPLPGLIVNVPIPPPPQTAVYNTLLLSIPGGMFSIPGDPPS